MLNKKVEDICNRQIEREGFSSNLYLAMASWAETSGFGGVASWLYTQSDEERVHMLKIFKYINERGGKAVMPALKKPEAEFKSVEDVFNEVLKHEEFVTASINEIVSLTLEEKDYNTHNFLQWFVSEQVEEEAIAQKLLKRMEMVGNNPAGLLMMDREMGMRVAGQ